MVIRKTENDLMLTQTFAAVRRSIVAFASKAAVVTKNNKVPPFPTIIGTGFVIDQRGIVATNRHVVRRLEKLPAHPETGESAAFALAYSDVKLNQGRTSMKVVPIGIKRWDKLTTFNGDAQFYGEPLPDLAFVQLNVSEIPAMSLAIEAGSWEVGTAIATAGFPLGEQALAIYGRVNQVAPILRQGIIASVYPFPCPRPHGFTIDVMTLGGESGSPIFRASDGTVVGLLHAGFNGTNITLSLPSWLVAQAFDQYLASVPLDFTAVPTFEEVLTGTATSKLHWESV